MELQDFLRQFRFNGQALDRGGTIDPSTGGFTVSNAPAIYARLLQQLSQPGGPLSSLESSRVLGGQVASITTAGEQERRSAGARLSSAGLNEAQAAAALSGIDTGVQRAIGAARAEETRRLSTGQQEALTGFSSVLAQSESTQKERAEQLRQFEIALKEMKKQQKFNRLISIASLGVSAFGAGMFSGLGGFFGGGEAPTTAAGNAPLPSAGITAQSALGGPNFGFDPLSQGVGTFRPQFPGVAPPTPFSTIGSVSPFGIRIPFPVQQFAR